MIAPANARSMPALFLREPPRAFASPPDFTRFNAWNSGSRGGIIGAASRSPPSFKRALPAVTHVRYLTVTRRSTCPTR